MLKWLKRGASRIRGRAAAGPELAIWRGPAATGKYVALYNYLDCRYATTVVLTFAEIEDLLGFALPDLARAQREWWTNPAPGAAASTYSESWTLASRTATPNLLARTVVFERAS
jgi:hypothetical protein